MCQGVEDTLFCCDVVVAVPVEVLVCMCGLSVDCSAESVVWFYGNQCVQERQ